MAKDVFDFSLLISYGVMVWYGMVGFLTEAATEEKEGRLV